MSDSSTNSPKSQFEIVVELVKALTWPLLVLFILLSFWSPLHSTAQQLPSIINRSEAISIAGLSLKVGGGLETEATPEVKQTLSKISPNDIRALLNAIEGTVFWQQEDSYYARINNAELIKLGLAEQMPDDELKMRNAAYGIHVTSLGEQVQEFLTALISKLVKELNQSPTSNLKNA